MQPLRLDEPVRWAERERVARELDEALLNLLQGEGYPVTDEELDEDSRTGGEPPSGQWPYVENA